MESLPGARRIIERLNSCAAVSPSGTGVQILEGQIAGGGGGTGKIEVYGSSALVINFNCDPDKPLP
jgi:primase-polymerase (primpol)-like protein